MVVGATLAGIATSRLRSSKDGATLTADADRRVDHALSTERSSRRRFRPAPRRPGAGEPDPHERDHERDDTDRCRGRSRSPASIDNPNPTAPLYLSLRSARSDQFVTTAIARKPTIGINPILRAFRERRRRDRRPRHRGDGHREHDEHSRATGPRLTRDRAAESRDGDPGQERGEGDAGARGHEDPEGRGRGGAPRSCRRRGTVPAVGTDVYVGVGVVGAVGAASDGAKSTGVGTASGVTAGVGVSGVTAGVGVTGVGSTVWATGVGSTDWGTGVGVTTGGGGGAAAGSTHAVPFQASSRGAVTVPVPSDVRISRIGIPTCRCVHRVPLL